jgi:aryl-alcohol dehydrogenase-like predicted oxidoreductase
MRYRAYGRSGLMVSEIGFGCGPTAGLMLGADPVAARATVARALELGVNLFDTAAAYGDGASERTLGATLKDLQARPLIATKVTLEAADMADIDAAVRRSIAGSLSRLEVERLDIVNLHNRVGPQRAAKSDVGSGAVVTADDVLGARGVVESLRRLQADGRVGLLGMSAFGGDVAVIRQIMDSSAFDGVMLNYSLINATAWRSPPPAQIRDYGGVAIQADAAGMGIVALRVLEGGLLAGAGRSAPSGAERAGAWRDSDRAQALLGALPAAEDSAEIAIRFVLSNPTVSSVMIGVTNIQQIETAVAASHRGALSEDLLARIEQLRAMDFHCGKPA